MKQLASLIDDYIEDYSVKEFLEDFGIEMTVGQMIEKLYDAGEIPEDVIERILGDEE